MKTMGTLQEKGGQEEAKSLPFHRLLIYADTLDWLLMVLGTLGSVVHGMAQPVGYLLLGKALDAYGRNAGNEKEMVSALEKVVPYVWYMAIATLPAGMLGNNSIMLFYFFQLVPA
ncbi:putative ABC transporter type 1, transmembrane domain superfamily [Dioscorea sansibarensis]